MKMERKLSRVGRRIPASPIQRLSRLAQKCNAVDLSEGFPDFPAPEEFKQAAVAAINSDFNQYRHVQGVCDLVAARMLPVEVDPSTDVVICCGQSGAFTAAMFAVIDPGDEVILFDPSYETYETCIRLAGGVPVYVDLEPPHWTLNRDQLEKSFTEKTKALVLNSPHNPTGKVFTKDELEIIAGACRSRDVFAVTDEVYGHLTYDGVPHISIASLPEMQRQTIITSSLSKTFSLTGWRVGWAVAPRSIASVIRNIHVKLNDSAPAPFQEAALVALASPPAYFDALQREYTSRRDSLFKTLTDIGFSIEFKPQGSTFIFAQLPARCPLSDVEFIEELIKQARVVAVPGCGFFHRENASSDHFSRRYIRFAFCKKDETLAAAAVKLMKLVDNETGHFKLF